MKIQKYFLQKRSAIKFCIDSILNRHKMIGNRSSYDKIRFKLNCIVIKKKIFFLYKKKIEDLPLAQEEDLLLAQEEDLLLVQEEDLLLVQEEDILLAQEEDLLLVQYMKHENKKIFFTKKDPHENSVQFPYLIIIK